MSCAASLGLSTAAAEETLREIVAAPLDCLTGQQVCKRLQAGTEAWRPGMIARVAR